MSLPWLPEATMFPYARPSYWCLCLSGRKRSMNGGCWEKFDGKMCVYCHKLNFFVMTQLLHKRYITSTADSKEVVERFAWEQKKLHRHRLAWLGKYIGDDSIKHWTLFSSSLMNINWIHSILEDMSFDWPCQDCKKCCTDGMQSLEKKVIIPS